MKNLTSKGEVSLKKFFELFDYYVEDMNNCNLIIGQDNSVIGIINDNRFKIVTSNEEIIGSFHEENGNLLVDYQITGSSLFKEYEKLVGSAVISKDKFLETELVAYDFCGNKLLKLITGKDDDYFYVKDYSLDEVGCMLRKTRKTGPYLKHITRIKEEKVWSTYMEVAVINNDGLHYVYEDDNTREKRKYDGAFSKEKFIEFGNVSSKINPRMHFFFNEIRQKLDFDEFNLFDQLISKGLSEFNENELGSIFRMNFKKNIFNKKMKVKSLF